MDAFFFLRHGQTDWNVQGLLMGQQDIPLNDDGRQQAYHAAKVLAGHEIASLCHSPLARAKETAQIIAGECHCNLYPLDPLKERCWGTWEGQVISSEQLLNANPPGAESESGFRERVLEGLSQAFAYPEPVLLVSHGGVFDIICEKLNLDGVALSNAIVIHVFKQLGKWNLEGLA